MNRRELMGAAAAFGVGGILPRTSIAAAPSVPPSLFDRVLDRTLTASPQIATLFGFDTGMHARLKHRLDDRSAVNRLGMYGSFLELAPALAATAVPPDPRGRQWLETVRWFADAARDIVAFEHLTVSSVTYPFPYALTQLTGAYVEVPDMLATQHSIADTVDCEAYLDRLAAFATAIDADTGMSRVQAAAGIIPPTVLCERTSSQLTDLANDSGARSSLVRALTTRAAAAGVSGDWERRATRLVDGPIRTALASQQAHMAELQSRADVRAGIGSRPQGGALYEMMLRFHLTTGSSPAEVHRIGLEQVAATQGEAGALMDRLGYPAGPAVARMNALAKDPAQLFPNTDVGREALLAFVRDRTEDVKRRIPAAFTRLPRTPMEVRRVPPTIQLGAPLAYSTAGSPDATRPGVIFFNLATTADWPKWQLPSTTYHEGFPGHHLQGSLVSEAPGIPDILKIVQPNAYNEGWGLYAEQVADELGVYDEAPLGRLGKLQASLFRACRLVVDTGIHAQGWSRERAIAYLIDEGGVPPETARRETERYMAWPGQACSYKMGYLEIMRQREAARARQGDRFSIKAFHEAVLMGGGMPMSVMDRLLSTTLA